MNDEFKNLILKQASKLKYRVADVAPSTELELFNGPKTLVIWSGASEGTIWEDARVNWAFRALHDALHLNTGMSFGPEAEMELGRIQANQYTGLMADLVYIETSGQAEHYLKTGQFVEDQVKFTMEALKKAG
jgi:hypothetical protein